MASNLLSIEDSLLGLGDSFHGRLAKLRVGALRIAYYYDYPDESTFRYRVYNMIQVINSFASHNSQRRQISASWFCHRDGDNLNLVVDNCDILIFVRSRFSRIVSNALCRAKSRGVKIFYDIDDLVVDTSLIPLIISTLDQDTNDEGVWQYWFQYVSRLRATMDECDAVIVTNARLAKHVSDLSSKVAHVIPNFFNKEQEIVSKKVRSSNTLASSSKRTDVRIGYFSGSPSHNRDFKVAAASILRILSQYRHVKFVVAGFLDLDSKFNKFSERIVRLPMMNFAPLQSAIGAVDLNISPLQNNLFTSCKSELKYFEAALVATPTLASHVGTLSDAIKSHNNGWLADSFQWTSLLEEVLDCIANEEVFDSICNQALEDAIINFGYSSMGRRINALLSQ